MDDPGATLAIEPTARNGRVATTRVMYLVNRYPEASHTFIRREIAALEALGVEVSRVSLRAPSGSSVDAADAREARLTRVILGSGSSWRLPLALAREALAAPSKFARAMATALRLARRSERGLVAHLAYLAEACVLKRWAASCGSGHVHVHFGTNPAAVALLCRLLGGPSYSFTVHGPDEFDSPRALALDEKIRGASFVVAISDFTRSQLFRWADPSDWPKIRVIRCGLDTSFLDAPAPPLPDSRRFVCVGRLAEQKGHLVLLEAAAILASEGRDFEIALVGVREEILRSRALVLPSFAEGLPVVLMEALALGRPAISTYVAGIPELIEPGVNGWLVPAGSAESLAGAMAECLETSSLGLAPMSHNGPAVVSGRHNIASAVRELSFEINSALSVFRAEAPHPRDR
jgi:glycosyltransferase involved in cell wall biosynthesis